MAKHGNKKRNVQKRKWAVIHAKNLLYAGGICRPIQGGHPAVFTELLKIRPQYQNLHYREGLVRFYDDERLSEGLPSRQVTPKKPPLLKKPVEPESPVRTLTPLEWVTSPAFLRSSAWRRLRMATLIRYGARCQCCGATARDGAIIHVDHIQSRKKHPELALDPNNLQVLCDACNHGKGNWDQTDWRPPQTPKGNEPPPTLN